MFNNVIVGVDGYDGGRDAVALANALCGGRLTLVEAYPVDPAPSTNPASRYEHVLRKDALRMLEGTRVEADVDAEVLPVADLSPARALHAVAEHREADLLVIGSAHHGRLGRILLGDVGRGVLRHAPCPVAVAPKRFWGVAPGRVAVGFDGSPEARAALELAAEYASDRGAALTVIVVWEDPPMPIAESAYLVDMNEMREERRRSADGVLADALAALPPSSAGQVLHGRPDVALASAAEDFDLLFVGSRGWGAVRRVALGSTSDRLVHRAPCPLIVVPRPADADEPGSAVAATESVGDSG